MNTVESFLKVNEADIQGSIRLDALLNDVS